MSLNICCTRASQSVTKNPPDRVVMIDVAFCKFLFITVVKTYLCAENLPVRAMFTQKRHCTVIILV